MKKPLIGVVPLVDIGRDSLWMLPGYMDGVAQAGGLPVMLPLTEDGQDLDRLAALCDAFLFTGGQDVDPALYGQSPLSGLEEVSPERDRMETALLERVLALDKPLLGICRGIQFLNAALGGDLWQDIPGQMPSDVTHRMKPPYDAVAHTVDLVPDTPLRQLLGREQIGVNSCHHQGVRTLAGCLSVMATAPDGLTEAAYMPGKRLVWAVQWHPEFSFRTDQASQMIFAAFVDAAR